MNREQLIEKARVAFNEAWATEDAYLTRNNHPKVEHTRSRAGIEAAFAVFEEAHTQTGERLRQARTEAATQHLRADKAEAQVRTAPTDDEREAIQEFEREIPDAYVMDSYDGPCIILTERSAKTALSALRRTVQGEPTDAEVNEIALAVLGPSRTYDREGLRKALADFLSNRSIK